MINSKLLKSEQLYMGKPDGCPKITVLICALNEAQNLPYVLPKIPIWIDEIMLVDGNSKDKTIEVAKKLCPRIRIIKQNGKGKGDALVYGFDNATGDIVVAIDADGSTNPNEIYSFVQPLTNGYDLCKGSRFKRGGGTEDMPVHRIFGNWCFTIFTNIIYKAKYTDLAYGYFSCRREIWSVIRPRSRDFSIETEITIRATKSNLKIIEIPSLELKRLSGKGNLRSLRDGSKILWTIIKYRFTK